MVRHDRRISHLGYQNHEKSEKKFRPLFSHLPPYCQADNLKIIHYIGETQTRRKRCGMAAVAAPKICRERGKKEEKGGKKEKREERKERRKGERKGEESKRERCITLKILICQKKGLI